VLAKGQKNFDESGTTSIEYALIAGLVAVVIASSVRLVGGTLLALYNRIANQPFW
jgi:Flp pilus assembly pilin Flp